MVKPLKTNLNKEEKEYLRYYLKNKPKNKSKLPLYITITISILLIIFIGVYSFITRPIIQQESLISKYISLNLSQVEEDVYSFNQTLDLGGKQIPLQIIIRDSGESVDLFLYTEDFNKLDIISILKEVI